MSPVRVRDDDVIAIFLADIHLTLNPPIWRSAESDWLEAQYRPIEEVKLLQDKFDCPIFCAGDIFEWWFAAFGKGGSELTNYAIDYLPDMYSIPGQHDLPLHQYEDIRKSAFWTLVQAKKIENLSHKISLTINNMRIFNFPYSFSITPCPKQMKDRIYIAIVHDYVWVPGCKYPEAPAEKRVRSTKLLNGKWMGYDIIIFGDNHKGFMTTVGETTVFNCGTLMRRKSDEVDYEPQVGLLLKSGEIVPHYLNTKEDKYLDVQGNIDDKDELDMKSFFRELELLGHTELSFVDACKRYFAAKKVVRETRMILLNAMEKRKR